MERRKPLMKKTLDVYEKVLAIASCAILLISLFFLMALGFYNHPLGDDYHYGQYAKQALDNGTFFDAIKEACLGVARQYKIWQGTYSAMFLMHLPPHIFSDFMYKLYPTVLLSLFTFSFFYLLKPVLIDNFKATVYEYLAVTSTTVILCLSFVPLMGETFYWFNGSMYYTGFFTLDIIFIGILIRFLKDSKTYRMIILGLMAVFIAGGNYVSLLPLMIITVFVLVLLFINKKPVKQKITVGMTIVLMLAGLTVSALAPGNKIRAVEYIGMSPKDAIIKSLQQGVFYIKAWSYIWIFIALILLAPVYINLIKKGQYTFKWPILITAFSYGVFASMSTPLLYAEGGVGPARVMDLSWYGMVILILGGSFYLLGGVVKFPLRIKKEPLSFKMALIISEAVILGIFLLSLTDRPLKQTYFKPNQITAATLIINKDAARFEEQWQERLRMVYSDEQNLVFEPYHDFDSVMYILFLGDLREDPDHYYNQAFARFYGKESVRLSSYY